MNNELSIKLKCLKTHSGVELWIDENRAEQLFKILERPDCPQFFRFDGRMISKGDIAGIYLATDLEDNTRRKNGQWKCMKCGRWNLKGKQCECEIPKSKDIIPDNFSKYDNIKPESLATNDDFKKARDIVKTRSWYKKRS